MKGFFLGTGALVVLALSVLSPVYADADSSGVSGAVSDALGRPLAGARVSLVDAAGDKLQTVSSDAAGHFHFSPVAPGTYAVSADKAAFQEGVGIVTLSDGKPGQVALALASDKALDVKVTAKRLDIARNGIATETGSSTYRITRKAIKALPRGSDTPLNQVLLQAPGVVQDSYGQLHVRGDHGDLQYRINDIILPESISGFGQTLDPAFAQNVTLTTGALPAQYGDRTAGVVNIDTKSGAFQQGGDIGVTAGSHDTRQVNGSVGGSQGKFNYYLNGSFLQNDLGVENPTSARDADHDRTLQNKGFGYLSYLFNADTRLSVILGNANSHFQIPSVPGQTPMYQYGNRTDYPSEQLDDNQNETTHYGIIALQGVVGANVDYQVSAFSRYTRVLFKPDRIGDLMYTGVASSTSRTALSNGLQADASYHLNDTNTLRTGLFFSRESLDNDNDILTFPADANGNQTSTDPRAFTDNSSKTAYLYGAYVQNEWQATDKLTINYGLRFDEVNAYVTGNQVSPRLGAVYTLTPKTTLHAGYARYFTPPPTELVSTETVSQFQGTTNAAPSTQNDPVRPEKDDYYDLGISHHLTDHLTLGLDGYYKQVSNLLDEGQFGSALIYTPFNYRDGKVYGVEFTANYHTENLSGYFNLARSAAYGRGIDSNQYQIDPDDLAYIANHWIHLDHDQSITASAGLSYLWRDTSYSVDGLYGSGLRRDGNVPNGRRLASYVQINLGVARGFNVPELGKLTGRVSVTNLFDKSYEIRDGSGVGVGAPQYGPRRAFYVSVNKSF